jgi:hypothetical protein
VWLSRGSGTILLQPRGLAHNFTNGGVTLDANRLTPSTHLLDLSVRQPGQDFRKNRLKERKLRQELRRRVLLVCSSSRTHINLIASLSKD